MIERYRRAHINKGCIVKNFIAGVIFAAASVTGMAQAAVSIVFDYSLDSNGFFTSERRAIAQAAAASLTSRIANANWARVDTSQAGGSYELAIVNPSTLGITWVPNVVIPENQITVRLGAMDWSTAPVSKFRGSTGDSVTQLLSIRNVSGGIANILTSPSKLRPVDASISFDLQGIQGLKPGITRQWYFGSAANLNTDDRNPVDPYYNIYSDFYTSLIHELGHILGIYDPGAFKALLATDPDFYNSMASDPNFFRAWTSRVQADGNGGYVFTGFYASQYYYNHVGQPIPLDTDTRCHWAVGVHSQSADGWPSVTYDPNTPFRHGFSELEFGALKDLGYTITPASPVTVTLSFVPGWNLVGNSVETPVTGGVGFDDATKVNTIWKWVTAGNTPGINYPAWAFYTPTLPDGGKAYAASKGYESLIAIAAGEGFWVNAASAFTTPLPSGMAVQSSSFTPSTASPPTAGGNHALAQQGWSLISTGDNPTPSQFAAAIATPISAQPAAGQVYTTATTLWAWDVAHANWYFWAPSLANSGNLANYISNKDYLDFSAMPGTPPGTLSPTMGFWVNLP